MDLMSKDAKWRKDPVLAAEMVTGWKWSNDGIEGWLQLGGGEYDGWIAHRDALASWRVYQSPVDDSLVYSGAQSSGAEDPSTALVEGVVLGVITLPESCPGIEVLKNF